MLLAPHPSILYVLINYHLRIVESPSRFILHLCCIYTLTFLAFSSLIVILAREPGPVNASKREGSAQADGEEDVNVLQALLSSNEEDMHTPGKWCRKCWAPKPERAHQ